MERDRWPQSTNVPGTPRAVKSRLDRRLSAQEQQRRNQQHIRTFASKREATVWRAEMQGEQKRGTHTPASTSITVAEVGKKWIEQAQADGLEPVTIAQL